MSVSPAQSSPSGFIPPEPAPAALVSVGRLYDGNMRGGGGSGAGSGHGSCVGEDEGEDGCGGSRPTVPWARNTKGILPTPLRCGTVWELTVIWTSVMASLCYK